MFSKEMKFMNGTLQDEAEDFERFLCGIKKQAKLFNLGELEP